MHAMQFEGDCAQDLQGNEQSNFKQKKWVDVLSIETKQEKVMLAFISLTLALWFSLLKISLFALAAELWAFSSSRIDARSTLELRTALQTFERAF